MNKKNYECPECKGDGELDGLVCYFCNGTGFATDDDVEEPFEGRW